MPRKQKPNHKLTPAPSLTGLPSKRVPYSSVETSKKNRLFYGDNLEILRKYVKDESVNLCYIDPPFNSKRTYNQIYNNKGQEDKAQAQAFVDTWTWDQYAETGYTEIMNNTGRVFTRQSIELIKGLENVLGKGSLLSYLIHMTLRIGEIYRILKPNGSFFLHCDPTASHYLKLIIDGIFCSQQGEFRNELIWCYSIGGKSKDAFGKKHDVIFYYTKCNNGSHTFNKKGASIPRKPNSHMKVGVAEDGREFQEKKDKKSGKVYRYYLDEGKIAEDYWIDIETLNREDKERLGYPTQKPELLLERIIKTATNEGDVVLDAYCGCGTTVAVAEKLNRSWIGIDITYQSISLILKRLGNSDNVTISGVPKDVETAVMLANKKDDRTRKEFEKWAVLTYSNNKAIINEKKGADQGIDGIEFILTGHNQYSKALFSVKSGNIGNSMIRDFCHVVNREKAAMGIFITLEEPTKPMIKEAKMMGMYQNPLTLQEYPKIQIVTIEEILSGERINLPQGVEALRHAEKINKVQAEFNFPE